MSEHLAIGDRDALLVVDIQNDFCPGGALAVPRGNEVVPLINRLAARFAHVVLTQDWHPAATNRSPPRIPGASRTRRSTSPMAADPVAGPLRAGNAGRRIVREICRFPMRSWCCARAITARSIPIRRSTRTTAGPRPASPDIFGSAACGGVFLAGLAFDFCVRYSAEDAQREGFDVVVIEDACRGIDVDGSMAATRQALAELGVRCISCAAIA